MMWKVILPALLILACAFLRVFESQENFLFDARLQMRPVQKVSPDIAIIDIDDKTLTTLGQWPLPRDFHASLLDVLKELGAKTVVFDLIFSEPSQHDLVFQESIKRSGLVVLPQVYDIPDRSSGKDIIALPHPILAPVSGSLKQGLVGFGHINVLLDSDGKFRRAPLFVKGEEGIMPHNGLIAACRHLGLDCGQVNFLPNKITIDGRLQIPVNDYNEMLVNYPGKWQDTFAHFSYLDILSDYQQWKTGQGSLGRLAELKGKVCFIGLTAAGTVDLKSTPLENKYPMVGLQASICNSILVNKFLKRASWEINALLVLGLYLVCILICARCKPWASLLYSMGLSLFCLVSLTLLLNAAGIWVDVFLPLMVILLVYLTCVAIRWAKERHQLELLEKEMIIGQKIQMQFLKGPKQETADLNIALWFQPAKFVAGDFYDVFKLEGGRVGIVIADVSGKGLPAALCMAQSISLFRIFSRQLAKPEETLMRLNQELCMRNSERFVTALYCIVDTNAGTIQMSSAGQGPAYIYRDKDKVIEELAVSASPPTGVMDDSVYDVKIYPLHKNDKLFLFSDGIYEARSKSGEEMGIERIKQALLANAHYPNQKILANMITMINEFSGRDHQHDDMTMIIFSLNN